MPKRRRRKRRSRFRRKRRRVQRSQIFTLVNKGPSPFPDQYMTRMTYGKFNGVVTVDQDTVTLKWSMNNITSLSVQDTNQRPMGYSELSNLYSRYLVVASSVSIQILNNDTEGMFLTLVPSLDSGDLTTYEGAAEQPYAKRKNIGAIAGIESRTISGYMGMKKFVGNKFTYQEESFSGIDGNGPDDQRYWKLQFQSTDATATSAMNFSYAVRLTYWVKWFSRNVLSVSSG